MRRAKVCQQFFVFVFFLASGGTSVAQRPAALPAASAVALPATLAQPKACQQPIYLTFDTGHMGVAPMVAEVLQRQQIKASFFLANERTQTGGGALDAHWLPWWKSMAEAGHVLASHTWDHWVWQADISRDPDSQTQASKNALRQFRVKATAGANAGKPQVVSAAAYCEQLRQPAQHLLEKIDVQLAPLFRAPGGKTSPALLQVAKSCGYTHVPWSAAGFLGDELPSDKFPNHALLAKALRDIRRGDILLAHLGIWSRKDPWAPAVLEPLIVGLKQKGFCFASLREHPDYAHAFK